MIEHDESSPPRRLNVVEVPRIDGYLFPFLEDQPALVRMAGSKALYLPVFSTIEKLRSFMDLVDIQYEKVKLILNEEEFLPSVIPHLKIAIDPHLNERGKFQWVEPRLLPEA